MQFIADLAVTIAGGLGGGWIAKKIGLHPILGYVVAGLIIGPFTPGYVADEHNLSILAELGLIFLLFAIGLEFSFDELRRLGFRFAGLWVLAAIAMVAAVALCAKLAGFPHAITMGLAFLVSSTAIGIAFLSDAGLLQAPAGRLVVPILILEDLVAVLLLVVIDQPSAELSFFGLLQPLLLTAAFVALSLIIGHAVIKPLVIRTLAKAPANQRVIVFTGIAVCAAYIGHLFGLSLAFGAFVAGAVIATLQQSHEVQKSIEPFKDLFVLCFFVSIGSVIDPALVIGNWMTVVALSLVIAGLRGATWYLFALRCGIEAGPAHMVALAMVPLGEFNIVLAQAGNRAGRLSDVELSALVGVTLGSIVIASLAQPIFARMLSGNLREQAA